jgi:hypothetical protein
MAGPLPSITPTGELRDLVRQLTHLVRALEIRLNEIEQVPGGSSYVTTNVTTARTFDADTVTLAQLADVVGTLITDMQGVNKLR